VRSEIYAYSQGKLTIAVVLQSGAEDRKKAEPAFAVITGSLE
jgi:hypothetical protein